MPTRPLYGAVWRICRELGARRVITYTQDGETGASLRAAGFTPVARRKAHPGWDRPSRRRVAAHPIDVGRVLWLRGEPLAQCHETPEESHETLRPRVCSQCGGELSQPKTGRPRRTCSDTCRQRARRKRRRVEPEPLVVTESQSELTLFG